MGPKQFDKDGAKFLVIVESPSKCAKIESYLGSQYKCIASNGHIRHIDGLKSVNTKLDYVPTFTIIKEKETHVAKMRKILEMFSKTHIILATDDDREGEAIAWHICETFGLSVSDTKRIKFNEITKPAIHKSIQDPLRIDMNLVRAQQARQVLDILVGFKISPLLWKFLYNDTKNGLSAGRCQTPALRLVYDNEKSKSDVTLAYKTRGRFTSKNIEFTLSREFDNKEDANNFLSKSMKFEHYLSIGSPIDSIRGPPKPFNTSRLLQAVSHISPLETMALCQTLYQEGYITYMRTENTKYSVEFLADASKYITDKWGDKYIGPIANLENIDKSNPHEAIRVTNIETLEINNKTNTRLASLYRLIWKNTVESCMADSKSSVTECRITAPDGLHYKHSIDIPTFAGWRKNGESEGSVSGNGTLFYFKSILAKPVNYAFIESAVSFHNKHSHYTEASLISKLEELGIGRPSTFASLVETIQDRGYVKKMNLEGVKFSCIDYKLSANKIEETAVERVNGNEKNKLIIQPTGILIIEFLISQFECLFSYDYTNQMEAKLDEISSNNVAIPWHDICRECHILIRSLTKNVSKESYKIDVNHDLVFTRNGPALSVKNSDGVIEYKSVRKDVPIVLDKLKRGEYTLDDLIEVQNRLIGKIGEHDVYIKHGRFGVYAEWGEHKKSLSELKKAESDITVDDIIGCAAPKSSGILRTLTDDLSIRKGKYGAYAHYQRKDMPKPEFYNIKKFREGFSNCNADVLIKWLSDTYNIS